MCAGVSRFSQSVVRGQPAVPGGSPSLEFECHAEGSLRTLGTAVFRPPVALTGKGRGLEVEIFVLPQGTRNCETVPQAKTQSLARPSYQ